MYCFQSGLKTEDILALLYDIGDAKTSAIAEFAKIVFVELTPQEKQT